MTKPKLFSLFLILSMAAGYLSSCSPKPQNDCGFVQNIYGQRIAWKTQAPVKIYLSPNIPPELRPAIQRAATTWDNQVGRKVIELVEDSSVGSTPSRDQKNAIYFLSEWESDRSSEQGRTSVYWAGDQIQEADIRINASNFSYYDQNTQVLVGSYALKKSGQTARDGYSFEALLLHEMGHLLGLKHRDEVPSVMATHLAAFTDRVALGTVDQASITCEYK